MRNLLPAYGYEDHQRDAEGGFGHFCFSLSQSLRFISQAVACHIVNREFAYLSANSVLGMRPIWLHHLHQTSAYFPPPYPHSVKLASCPMNFPQMLLITA